ncbi:MAG TPA: hypothetical protein PKA64_00895 [Myxococcota bacterium]|nr:hypothetical protein [Myxococcota bacterium]
MTRAPATLRWGLAAIGVWAAAAGLAGCTEMDEVFPDPSSARGYKLVGAYDSTAVRGMDLLLAEDQRPKPYEYIWLPPAAMKKACGPAKGPDGLGIFEAEAVANRMMPALVLVLEREGDVPALDTSQVQVAIGEDAPRFFLKPMVQPRYLQITVDGTAEDRYLQQVKTQLQTYLCMEHKTGRAWQGGKLEQVRQALLLNPPDAVKTTDPDPSDEKDDEIRLADRKFFGGQSEPVAGLLGPPSMCLSGVAGRGERSGRGGQGDVSLNLVPSDVWGASLLRCREGVKAGARYVGPTPLELALSDLPEVDDPEHRRIKAERAKEEAEKAAEAVRQESVPESPTAWRRTWSEVHITVREGADKTPSQQFAKVDFEGRELVGESPGANKGTIFEDGQMFVELDSGEVGLVDMVSRIPYRYPTVGDELDPDRYTVLIVPNWQLVEGIRRLHAGALERPRATAGEGDQDGVGWLLQHPEWLYVMVPREPASTPAPPSGEPDDGSADAWLNVAGVMSGGTGGLRDWGYAVGMLAGRAPIVLPGIVTPTWSQVLAAQRAAQHSLVLGASAILFGLLASGLVRLRDLWSRVPEERVDFWPGPPPSEEDGSDDMAELSKAGGEEKK